MPSFSPGEANYFYRQLRDIQVRAYWDARRGDYDPRWTDAQLERLHERMHIAHERGHERLDNDWNRESYGYRGYSAPTQGYARPYGYDNGYSYSYTYGYRR